MVVEETVIKVIDGQLQLYQNGEKVTKKMQQQQYATQAHKKIKSNNEKTTRKTKTREQKPCFCMVVQMRTN